MPKAKPTRRRRMRDFPAIPPIDPVMPADRRPRINQRRFGVAFVTLLVIEVGLFALMSRTLHLPIKPLSVAITLLTFAMVTLFGLRVLLRVWRRTRRRYWRVLASIGTAWIAFGLVGTAYSTVSLRNSLVDYVLWPPLIFVFILIYSPVFVWVWLPLGGLAYPLVNYVAE